MNSLKITLTSSMTLQMVRDLFTYKHQFNEGYLYTIYVRERTGRGGEALLTSRANCKGWKAKSAVRTWWFYKLFALYWYWCCKLIPYSNSTQGYWFPKNLKLQISNTIFGVLERTLCNCEPTFFFRALKNPSW